MRVRQKLGELLNEVRYRKGNVLITKAGKPVAALVDIALFERIRKLDEEFESLTKDLARAFRRVPPRKGIALVDEGVTAARRKSTKR
ncbi:MAG: type II toxin-antitoxin system prevent-host-death family antitoxin [Vicinamibacteria bacterium]